MQIADIRQHTTPGTSTATTSKAPKILILGTLSGGYRGADATGQSHLDYSPNTYVLPIRTAAIFPPSFYMDAFRRGIDGIIVMYSGTDSSFKGDSERTGENINETYRLMKEQGIDTRRLRLVAICTVCVRPFLTEIREMNVLLEEIGPVSRSLVTGLAGVGEVVGAPSVEVSGREASYGTQ